MREAASVPQRWSAVDVVGSWRAITHLLSDSRVFEHFNLPLRAIGVWCLWFAGIVGLGFAVLGFLRFRQVPREALLFSLLCGFVVGGIAILLIGLLGLARPLELFVIPVVGILLGARNGRQFAEIFVSFPRPMRFPIRANAGRNIVGLLCLIVICTSFLYALTPPIQSDAMRYHLAVPQEYLKNGRIGYLPHNAFSNFPLLAEMHYMLALAAGAPEAAQLMHWTLWLFSGFAVMLFTQRVLRVATKGAEDTEKGRGTLMLAPFAGAAYLFYPAGVVLAGWPFSDHAVTLFFFASVYVLAIALQEQGPGDWIICGIVAGGALGVKYTALAFLPCAAVAAAVAWWFGTQTFPQGDRGNQVASGIDSATADHRLPPPSASLQSGYKLSARRRCPFLHLLYFGLVLMLSGGVWFAKNVAFTGNPVYPLANSYLHAAEWSEANSLLYVRKTNEKGVAKTVRNFLLAPVIASKNGTAFEWHYAGGAAAAIALLAIAGTIVSVLRRSHAAFALICSTGAALAYYGIWFFSYQSNRLIMPSIALAIPGACFAFHELLQHSRCAFRLALFAIILALVQGSGWAMQWVFARAQPPVITYLAGASSKDEYLTRALNYWPAFEFLNVRVNTNQHVLLIGEHRIYGAKFNAEWSDWFDTPAFLALIRDNKIHTVQEFTKLLRDRHMPWLFYNSTELRGQLDSYFRPRFTDEEWRLLNQVLASEEFEQHRVPPGNTILRLKQL